MELTIFTLIITVFWVSIFVKIISSLRKQMAVLNCFSIYSLLFLLMLCILRVIFPFGFPFTILIESEKILSPIQHFLCTPFTIICGSDITVFRIILGIWILGAVVILTKQLHSARRFRHIVDILPAAKDKRLYHILGKANSGKLKTFDIKIHKYFQSPAVIGIFHPVILLPEMEFSDDQLFGIFLHEISHFKFRHQIIKLIAECIRVCFWWNPIFRTLSDEVAHALEMHSDKMVCSKLNQRQRLEYCKSITRVIENRNRFSSPALYGCGLIEENDDDKLAQRFLMILGNGYQNNKKFPLLMMLLIFAVFLSSYSFVVQPRSEPALEFYDSGVVNLEDGNSYYYEKTENGYEWYDSSGHHIKAVMDLEFDDFN